jgi:hypothetical protein
MGAVVGTQVTQIPKCVKPRCRPFMPPHTRAAAPTRSKAGPQRPRRPAPNDPPGDLAADVVRHVHRDVVAEELHPPRVLAVDRPAQLRLRRVPRLGRLEGDVGRRVVDDGEGRHPEVVAQPGHEPDERWGGRRGWVGWIQFGRTRGRVERLICYAEQALPTHTPKNTHAGKHRRNHGPETHQYLASPASPV